MAPLERNVDRVALGYCAVAVLRCGHITPAADQRDLASPLAVYHSGPPTFEIGGPTVVRPGQLCTWSARGIGIPVIINYQWSGLLAGDGYSITGSVDSPGYLCVTATDGWGRQGWGSIYVTVDPQLETKACV